MRSERSALIRYSHLFDKQRKSLPLAIKIAFREARELFLENPKHSSLRDHPLRRDLQGYRSIDITDDYRAIYRKSIVGGKDIITFHMIGTHKTLYGKRR